MNIEYYTKENGSVPVRDYIMDLNYKFRAKVALEISLLEKYGMALKLPYVRSIKGKKYNKLFELRIKFSSDISRVFYFCNYNNTFILLHGYTKKTNKTDKNELDIALSYMLDYNERFGDKNEK